MNGQPDLVVAIDLGTTYTGIMLNLPHTLPVPLLPREDLILGDCYMPN